MDTGRYVLSGGKKVVKNAFSADGEGNG